MRVTTGNFISQYNNKTRKLNNNMTKKQYQNYARLSDALIALGITSAEEQDQLFKIERTLHRWHELECGTDRGCIERDEITGKPMITYARPGNFRGCYQIADREKGALKRLAKLMANHPPLWYYMCAKLIRGDAHCMWARKLSMKLLRRLNVTTHISGGSNSCY